MSSGSRRGGSASPYPSPSPNPSPNPNPNAYLNLLLPLLTAGTYYLSVTLEPAGASIGDVKRHPISIAAPAPTIAAPPAAEGEEPLAMELN